MNAVTADSTPREIPRLDARLGPARSGNARGAAETAMLSVSLAPCTRSRPQIPRPAAAPALEPETAPGPPREPTPEPAAQTAPPTAVETEPGPERTDELPMRGDRAASEEAPAGAEAGQPFEEELILDAEWSMAEEFEAEAEAEVEVEVEAAPASAQPAPGPAGGELDLVSGPDLYSPLPATPPTEQPSIAREALDAALKMDPGSVDPPLFEDVADRLERIARSLRDRTPAEMLFAEGAADPLQVLITGYALGYSEALRRTRERERQPRS